MNKRPRVKGKFLAVEGEKFYVKGVTYGTFSPNDEGNQFPLPTVMDADFALMAENGVNTLRTYTAPTQELLDLARKHGLKVMAGLPWEQHITFLDSPKRIRKIVEKLKEDVRSLNRHPAILCYTVGNEIPAPIVRWHGKKAIEKFLRTLYLAVKSADPEGLVTYVNFPTTEYLDLSFMDFDCFNVYLETQEKLEKYLARLHNLCGERPLVMAEIGLDSMRNGLEKQAEVLDWQVRTVFAKGCAGAFVFSWTDEWWRGGFEIEDWDFGLVDRERKPKPALERVARAFAQAPYAPENVEWPKFSIVVCSYNGSATIRDTMEGLMRLDYPNYEVIVVNDGSKDHTAEIVKEYPFRLISTENRGLSNARNTGMYQATGDIVAYIDDDAYPDPQWLRYLAYGYIHSDIGGLGGPNLAPEGDGFIAECVVNSPGGPVHVLTSDEMAEHIPGCNMSFRREALLEVRGFDPIYRAAGDDVDLCWRIQEAGYTIGFHPSAFVWHHRRNSMRMYWKQQQGYGKAEALLEYKWPEKYNHFGHLTWGGKIYGNGLTLPLNIKKKKVMYGTWGSALFQSVYEPHLPAAAFIPLMPEWFILIAFLAATSLMGIFWAPLLWVIPFFLLSLGLVMAQAGLSATRAKFHDPPTTAWGKCKAWCLVTWMHIIQPIARLKGRIKHGLTPWRERGLKASARKYFLAAFPSRQNHWSETWRSLEDWLTDIERNLMEARVLVKRGNEFDRWDLEASSGLFASGRAILTIEEHGGGKQYLKFRSWTKYSLTGLILPTFFLMLAGLAVVGGSILAMLYFGFFAVLIFAKAYIDTRRSKFNLRVAFDKLGSDLEEALDHPSIPGETDLEVVPATQQPIRRAGEPEWDWEDISSINQLTTVYRFRKPSI